MKHSDGRFTGAGERSIYFQWWEPESAPKAVLLVAHGAGEHSARYQTLAQFFTGHNFALQRWIITGTAIQRVTPAT